MSEEGKAGAALPKYAEAMKANPPRLVVHYERCPQKGDKFSWGVVGQIPLMSLIGGVARVQGDLSYRAFEHCDELALVLAWDEKKQEFAVFYHRGVPVDPLVGMLECVKQALVMSKMDSMFKDRAAEQVQAVASPLLGPDGAPLRRPPSLEHRGGSGRFA